MQGEEPFYPQVRSFAIVSNDPVGGDSGGAMIDPDGNLFAITVDYVRDSQGMDIKGGGTKGASVFSIQRHIARHT